MSFIEVNPFEVDFNAFSLLDKEWVLLTVSDGQGKENTMTASWGGFGVLWNKPIAICFVRKSRYTHELICQNDKITFSVLREGYRDVLGLCGKVSGRDTDKIKASGLTPIREGNACWFEEARLVIVGRLLYRDDIRESCFVDKTIASFYADRDYHDMMIYEIEKVLVPEKPKDEHDEG